MKKALFVCVGNAGRSGGTNAQWPEDGSGVSSAGARAPWSIQSRRILIWASGDISPISSRKSVPPSASSIRPTLA